MSLLPVAAVVDDVVDALRVAPVVLLNAPTGAGKSTWLPLQLLQRRTGQGRIIMLEPRRLAARAVAQRLADTLGEPTGQTIGYRMRSETCVGNATRLEVVTEGILTRMIQQDPELTGIDLVILDEFHERSLQADLALALLLDVQQGLRDDLKLLIMSATLDDNRLSALLPDAPLITSQGRSWPVERRYLSLPAHQRFEESVAIATLGLINQEPGSVLLFLPGVSEILRVQDALALRVGEEVLLCPLYGALSLPEQQKAIQPAPAGFRKVVLATNIAETSLTIEGIRLVVDSTLERAARFDLRTGLTRLETLRISQASMTQRAGRAGRLEAGICLHLTSKEQAERAPAQSEPEILNSALSNLLLELTQWGCQDISQLAWLDLPPTPAISAAQYLLTSLGILGEQGALTPLGRRVASMGVEPRLGVILASAHSADEQVTAARLVAMIEEPLRNADISLDALFDRRLPQWEKRSQQLCRRMGWRGGRADIRLAAGLLAAAFVDRIARRRGQGGRYLLANGMGAMVDQEHPLNRHEWVLALSLLQGNNSPDARILLALPLDLDALLAENSTLLQVRDSVEWHDAQGTLRAVRRWQIGELVVRSQPLAKPPQDVLIPALLNGIRDKGLGVLPWGPEAVQLRLRLQCAARWLPEIAWPAVDDDALLSSMETWLEPEIQQVTSLQSLQNIDLVKALYNLLDWSLRQRLDSALPTHYTVPTGSRIVIRYHADNPPVLAVRMQEMFGEAATPLVAEGRVPVTLELLSPAQRPLQVTSDLAGFWDGAYREVQKEMKGRYPKHVWPDSPATALPTRKTKKYQ